MEKTKSVKFRLPDVSLHDTKIGMSNLTDRIRKAGIAKVAEQLSVAPTTVQYWTKTGRVPYWREVDVMSALALLDRRAARNGS